MKFCYPPQWPVSQYQHCRQLSVAYIKFSFKQWTARQHWFTSVTPALGRLRQKGYEFEVRLNYIRSYIKSKKQTMPPNKITNTAIYPRPLHVTRTAQLSSLSYLLSTSQGKYTTAYVANLLRDVMSCCYTQGCNSNCLDSELNYSSTTFIKLGLLESKQSF